MQNAAITCEPGKGEYICTKCGEKQEKSIPEEHIMVNRVCIACGYHDELPELSVGMSKSQVESKWGEPIQVDKYTSERGTMET